MPRYSAGVVTGAGSTTLPIISLYAAAAVGARIREIGATNTTATEVVLKLIRMTTTGTRGSALTNAKHDPASAAAGCSAYGTHTVTATNTDMGYRTVLGAAIGSGVIWTFGDSGLVIPVGTGNGIGIMVGSGTGQACSCYIVWDE